LQDVADLLVRLSAHQGFPLAVDGPLEGLQQSRLLERVGDAGQQFLKHLVLIVRQAGVVGSYLFGEQGELLIVHVLHLVVLEHHLKVLVKDLIVEAILAAQGVPEEDAHGVDGHQVLLEDLLDAGLEDLEGVRVVVLDGELDDGGEELGGNDVLDVDLLLVLHLDHLGGNVDALLLDRLLPGLVEGNQELQVLQQILEVDCDGVGSLY
jgi:hypothetical protein